MKTKEQPKKQKQPISPQMKIKLNRLSKRLELAAGFLTNGEKFHLTVNPHSNKSFWNWKKRHIEIGVEGIQEEKLDSLGNLITHHECGHVNCTSRNIDDKKLGYPFDLLNILEDARIEALNGKVHFGPLHDYSHQRYYAEKASDRSNPYNIGILLRWRRWDVQTTTQQPSVLDEKSYQQLLQDWENALNKSIAAPTTTGADRQAKTLYLKWKDLFDSATPPEIETGMTEAGPSDFTGQGEPTEDEEPGNGSNPSSDIRHIEKHFEGDAFDWDIPYIQRQAAILKKLIQPKAQEEEEFGMQGRHFDPPRIDNPPLQPFKEPLQLNRRLSIPKPLRIVIDGSGSMGGEPFRAASHIARALSLVFPAVIDITTTSSKNPIRVPLPHIDILSRYTSWGGGENYRSLGKKVTGYSFTLILTDANVVKEDIEYVKGTLRKLTKLGAGYVGERKHQLENVFDRTFFSDTLNEDIARMVALFLRRHFATMTTTSL